EPGQRLRRTLEASDALADTAEQRGCADTSPRRTLGLEQIILHPVEVGLEDPGQPCRLVEEGSPQPLKGQVRPRGDGTLEGCASDLVRSAQRLPPPGHEQLLGEKEPQGARTPLARLGAVLEVREDARDPPLVDDEPRGLVDLREHRCDRPGERAAQKALPGVRVDQIEVEPDPARTLLDGEIDRLRRARAGHESHRPESTLRLSGGGIEGRGRHGRDASNRAASASRASLLAAPLSADAYGGRLKLVTGKPTGLWCPS